MPPLHCNYAAKHPVPQSPPVIQRVVRHGRGVGGPHIARGISLLCALYLQAQLVLSRAGSTGARLDKHRARDGPRRGSLAGTVSASRGSDVRGPVTAVCPPYDTRSWHQSSTRRICLYRVGGSLSAPGCPG